MLPADVSCLPYHVMVGHKPRSPRISGGMNVGALLWCSKATGRGSSGEWWRPYAAPGWSRDRTKPAENYWMPTPLELHSPGWGSEVQAGIGTTGNDCGTTSGKLAPYNTTLVPPWPSWSQGG